MITISSQTVYIIFLITLAAVGLLLILLILKNSKIDQYKNTLIKMNQSFNELDEQAKLIVRTDLELNKAQEELDRRLTSLDALQKTSRLISTTLDEDEIFSRLERSLLTDLGFEKNLILVYGDQSTLEPRINLGFTPKEIEVIVSYLQKENNLLSSLKEGHTFSSATSPKQRKETIIQIFNVSHFVLTPIMTQNGAIGLVFVGNRANVSSITEGDEELVSILANQIGQSIENARLFEQVFRSRQTLENKVSERTRELAQALNQVQNISQMKSEFISAVSHELRTPLTSVKGYASLLMTGKLGAIPDQVKERLEKINMHSDNLVKLINDLLDIARIESGKATMNFSKCSLARIIDNIRDLFYPQMKDKSIQFIQEVPENLPEMLLDTSQIERVFINLVGNAIKFTPVNGKITIHVELKNNEVTVAVSDNGIGIKEEDLVKLFNEFYRVENQINQNVKGTGLGLSLAKKIIEAHKGKVWVTSKVNEGTTFHFTLPVNHESSPTQKN